MPMLRAIERPIALQSEYRPPTQSQNSNTRAGWTPKRPVASRLVLSATKSERSLASLSIELAPGKSTPTACDNASLEALRCAIPAACGLPLLQALARDEERLQTLVLTYLPTLTLKLTLQRVNLHALA